MRRRGTTKSNFRARRWAPAMPRPRPWPPVVPMSRHEQATRRVLAASVVGPGDGSPFCHVAVQTARVAGFVGHQGRNIGGSLAPGYGLCGLAERPVAWGAAAADALRLVHQRWWHGTWRSGAECTTLRCVGRRLRDDPVRSGKNRLVTAATRRAGPPAGHTTRTPGPWIDPFPHVVSRLGRKYGGSVP
jgi:hypothetical protein